jgi:hypothetical protein
MSTGHCDHDACECFRDTEFELAVTRDILRVVAKAAESLVSRTDFWHDAVNQMGSIPGEFDNLVDALLQVDALDRDFPKEAK